MRARLASVADRLVRSGQNDYADAIGLLDEHIARRRSERVASDESALRDKNAAAEQAAALDAAFAALDHCQVQLADDISRFLNAMRRAGNPGLKPFHEESLHSTPFAVRGPRRAGGGRRGWLLLACRPGNRLSPGIAITQRGKLRWCTGEYDGSRSIAVWAHHPATTPWSPTPDDVASAMASVLARHRVDL